MAEPSRRSSLAGFEHRYEPGEKGATTLLLLHGTGGNESDLLGLGRGLRPGAALLSPRGPVSEMGMARFFRRLAEGVFDEADVRARAGQLAAFVAAASVAYRFEPTRVVAVGFSNGANIAAATLLLHPGVLAGAVLFRAMPPLSHPPSPDLAGCQVLMAEGRHDPLVSRAQGEALAATLRRGGADVTLAWQEASHGLVGADIDLASSWLDAHDF